MCVYVWVLVCFSVCVCVYVHVIPGDFSLNVSRFSTEFWVTASILRAQGLFWLFQTISNMLWFGWSCFFPFQLLQCLLKGLFFCVSTLLSHLWLKRKSNLKPNDCSKKKRKEKNTYFDTYLTQSSLFLYQFFNILLHSLIMGFSGFFFLQHIIYTYYSIRAYLHVIG